jgi:2-polyprenyl-6-methoxyphenol hydroxylase-like FAD-dependent oxidoreductase
LSHARDTYPVIISGGGPVGLFLALRLIQSGIKCLVLEKKTEIDRHSKSLGIHPVSLELFEKAGISDYMIRNGIKILKGHAYADEKMLGSISFENCPLPFNYILSLPQYQTERILEDQLHQIAPGSLQRGIELIGLKQDENHVYLNCKKGTELLKLKAEWLVGCDGKNSIVRNMAGLDFKGKQYPDTYIMGDFEDRTSFGSDAAVYIHRDGLVESFPLPGSIRRWVVKTDTFIENPTLRILACLLNDRIDIDITGSKMHLISSFGVQHYLAGSFFSGRVSLAGDSAHVVSPIGGQGMNLGWITADYLADTFNHIMQNTGDPAKLMKSYSDNSRDIARQVAMRAEINMRLGRKQQLPIFQRMLIGVMVKTPLKNVLARFFTMRGLGNWWI